MAKKASLVDKALEVSRKVRVPKKPVKTKGKKTIPAVLDWGTGIPEDKLAYLNDDEMALVEANRMFKGKRSHKGVPAFPDPGDTAAGASKSTGPDRGPTGGPSRTSPSSGSTSGLGGGGKGGPSSGGAGTGSGGQSSPSGGQSSPSASSDKGGQKATPSGGPTGGSLSAPARTEPSRGATPPSTFGPRTSSMPGTPVSTAQPSMAYQGAVDRIARGSSVIGGSPSSKIQDRVPQAQPPTVSFSQAPTVGPNRGLGGLSVPQEDYTVGANSPFASPGLAGYDREIYNKPSVAPSTYGNILGPSVPAGTAIQKDPYFGPEQVAARFRGNPTAQPVSYSATDPRVSQTPIGAYPAPSPVAQDPSLAGRALDAQTLGEQLAFASGAAANKIGSYIGSAAQNVGNYVGSLFGGEPATQTAATKTPAQEAAELQNLINQNKVAAVTQVAPQTVSPTASYSSPEMVSDMGAVTFSSLANPEQILSNYNVSLPNVEYGNLGKVSAINADVARAAPEISRAVVGPPSGKEFQDRLDIETPYGSASPSQIAAMNPADQQKLNAIAQNIAYEPPTITRPVNYGFVNPYAGTTPSAPTPVSVATETPQYAYNDVPFSQGDYSPSQAPAYDVAPSQQSGWTNEQRDAYLKTLEGDRNGLPFEPFRKAPPIGRGPGKKDDKTYLTPLPPWQDYDYLYTDYPSLAYAPSQRITDFNNYSATLKRGGRVGDSVDAALRLARHSIVSRPKTR